LSSAGLVYKVNFSYTSNKSYEVFGWIEMEGGRRLL
jgi:hypothetical protein